MRYHLPVLRRVFWLAGLAAMAMGHAAAAAEPAEDPLARIRAAKLETAAAASALADVLLDAGDAVLDRVIGALRPPGEPEDGPVRLVLHAMAVAAAGPHAVEHRERLTAALARALRLDRPLEVRRFLLEQLRIVGGPAAVPAVAACLSEPALADAAIATLEAFADPVADRALAAAVSQNPAGILPALGRRRVAEAVPELLRRAEDPEPAVRVAARRALAEIGDPRAAELIERWAPEGGLPLALIYARRRADLGDRNEAMRLLRRLADGPKAAAAPSDRIALLTALFDLGAPDAIEWMGHAADDEDPEISAAALRALAAPTDPAAHSRLARRCTEGDPARRCMALHALPRPPGRAWAPTVEAALADTNDTVAAAAADLADCLEPRRRVQLLAAALSRTNHLDVFRAALARCPEEALTAQVAADLPHAPPEVRRQLLRALAAGRSPASVELLRKALTSDNDDGVRAAAASALASAGSPADIPLLLDVVVAGFPLSSEAARKAVVALSESAAADRRAFQTLEAWKRSDSKGWKHLMPLLAALGGPAGLEPVVALARDAKHPLRGDAIRALAQWSTADAAAPLLDIAEAAAGEREAVMALRGVARLAREANAPDEAKAGWLERALAAARSDNEARELLGALGSIRHSKALRAAVARLEAGALAPEAAVAAARIVLGPKPAADVRLSASEIDALRAALPHLPDGELKEQVRRALAVAIPAAP